MIGFYDYTVILTYLSILIRDGRCDCLSQRNRTSLHWNVLPAVFRTYVIPLMEK